MCPYRFTLTLPTMACQLNTRGTLAIEHNTCDLYAGFNDQVRARCDRIEKGTGAITALAIWGLSHLKKATSFLFRTIEIVVERQAGFATGFHERIASGEVKISVDNIHAAT